MVKNYLYSILGYVMVVVGLALPETVLAQETPMWEGTEISSTVASSSAPVYLYNVGADAWLINAGNWGTQAATNKDYGIPVVQVRQAESSSPLLFNLRTGLNTNEGVWLGFTHDSAWDNELLFCDRGGNGSTPSDGNAIMNFTFTKVDGTSNNEYYITFSYKGNTYYVSASSAAGESLACSDEIDGDKSKWIIVTTSTINEKLQTSPANLNNPVNITYAISDAGLVRGSTTETQWISTLSKNSLHLGAQYYYKTTPGGNYSYHNAPGYEAQGNYVQAKGKYFGAQVKGATGKFQQTFKVYYTGWYRVSCQGFFWNESKAKNDVASLFVSDGDVTRSIPLALGNVEGDVPSDWDEAAIELYGRTRYKNQVMIKITMPEGQNYYEAGKDITVGIDFASVASDDDWTVFDDFQIEFLGYNTELVLKEDNLDYNYLLNTKEEYKNTTLWLNRTFSIDKWNTLVLPVALNKGQFITAFGTSARAAELMSVEDGVLRFTTIRKTGKEDNDEFLLANKPYIVYITEEPSLTEEQVVTLTRNDDSMFEVKIGGEDCPYYAIPYVSLDKDDVKSPIGQIKGAYSVSDGESELTFNGTLLRTYDEDFNIRTEEGFSDMEYNIILKNGQFWWLNEPYGMKAYRAWIEAGDYIPTIDNGSMDSKLTFEIDGVEDEATLIRDLNGDNEPVAEKFANGIFTINGINMGATSMENLPKGIYISNGKKYIVK